MLQLDIGVVSLGRNSSLALIQHVFRPSSWFHHISLCTTLLLLPSPQLLWSGSASWEIAQTVFASSFTSGCGNSRCWHDQIKDIHTGRFLHSSKNLDILGCGFPGRFLIILFENKIITEILESTFGFLEDLLEDNFMPLIQEKWLKMRNTSRSRPVWSCLKLYIRES